MDPNQWNLWEIPLGIATGGISAINHGLIQGGYNLTKSAAENIGQSVGSSAMQIADDDIAHQDQFNAEQAQIQRDWEKMMSDTEIQRRVADIKAAGLNPYLALGSLGGASTPSGASAQSNTAFAGVYGSTALLKSFIQAITALGSSAMQTIGSIAKIAAM